MLDLFHEIANIDIMDLDFLKKTENRIIAISCFDETNLPGCEVNYLEEDDPELWELVKEHVLDWDKENDLPLKCKKCGEDPIQKMNLLWVCPMIYDIPDKYFHAG